MRYDFNWRQAPRIVLLPVIAAVLSIGSIVVIVLVNVIAGIIALVISAWISYQLVRFMVSHMKSHVKTTESGLSSLTSFGVTLTMGWEDVSHAGAFEAGKSGRYVFVYNEAEDDLLSIPSYYTNFRELEAQIRAHTDEFLELSGSGPDDLAGALRPYLEG
jgi:hypothetical protein